MDKRTIKTSRLLIDDLWCCIRYKDDGVLEVRRKEELVPESDQERCGTTLVIGEACTAKYMDSVIYPATVVFESDEKEHCIKFKVDEEKLQKMNKAKKLKPKSKPAELAPVKKNLKRNEKNESSKKKRKTTEKTDENLSNDQESASVNSASKRKKEIKELEKKRCLAITKTAQEHAAKLFQKLHDKNEIEPANDDVSKSPVQKPETPSALQEGLDQLPKVVPKDQAPQTVSNDQPPNVVTMDQTPKTLTKDQTSKVSPVDQTSPCPQVVLSKRSLLAFPENQTLMAAPTHQTLQTNSTGQTLSEVPMNQTQSAHSRDYTPTVLSRELSTVANPKCQTTATLNPSFTSFAPDSNSSNVLQQSREFDPSAFPSGHIQPPFYSQMSPFPNALQQPFIPAPNFTYNFPYNPLPNAPGYPQSDFTSQVFPNNSHFNAEMLKSNCILQSYSTHNPYNNASSTSAMSQSPTPSTTLTTQSTFTSSNSNYASKPDSVCSPSPDDSTNFSPSEFISSSMALLDNTDQTSNVDIENISDIDDGINFEGSNSNTDTEKTQKDNMHETQTYTTSGSLIQTTNKKSPCPECLRKDKEIADLKMRLYKAGASSSIGEVISKTKTYKPKTRPEIQMGDYVIVPEKSVPPVGFQLLAPGAKIAVKPLWLEETLSTVGKSRDRRNKKALKKKKTINLNYGNEALKKLMDGFFDPVELAVGGGTTAFNGHPIFESLKLYAIHSLSMDIPCFNECWREKMSSAKQTIKRQMRINTPQYTS